MSDAESTLEPDRWFRYALEDLQWAEEGLMSPHLPHRPACAHAQQAAEKALKAGLARERIEFPRTHNLNVLRNLLPEHWSVKAEFPDLAELSIWAVDARYPGDWPEPTEDDARHAVEQARGVVESIERDLAALDETAQSDQ